MKRIVATTGYPGKKFSNLVKEHGIEIVAPDRIPSKEEILSFVEGIEILIPTIVDTIDKEVIDKAGNSLKLIANYGVGYNHIDTAYADSKGIIVTNTPGALTDTTADLTFSLIMAVSRRVTEGDRLVREGNFKIWMPTLLLGSDIYGKTLGIIGFGRIGQAVAKRAKGFDMKIFYFSRKRVDKQIEKELNAKYLQIDKLLKASDFVSLNLPLNNETYHLITYEKLKLMKKSAFLINTSRGAVIKEDDLAMAVKEGLIAGAGLDVYEFEPKIHPELVKLNNTVLLPHIGSATVETRTRMADTVVDEIKRYLSGKKPVNRITV